MRKRWRDFTWTPVVPRGAWALCASCWSHFQSVLVFPSPPAQLVSTTDLICLQSKRRRENLLRKNGPGLWSDHGKAVINPVKKLFVAFFPCVFFSALHHPQELWVRVTAPSGIWYKNVKNKQWKRMRSQHSASTQVLHPQIWWNLNGRCTPTRLQFFHLHTLHPVTAVRETLLEPASALQNASCQQFWPCWQWSLSTSQFPCPWLPCEWTPGILSAPCSPSLGKSKQTLSARS